MEEYKKLMWSRHNPRSEGRLLEQASIDFADFQHDIFNLHINEIDPNHRIEDALGTGSAGDLDPFLPVEMPTDPRTGQTVSQLELNCVKPLLLYDQFPSGSVLSREEHQHCLMVQNRINTRLPFNTAKDTKNYDQYQQLMEKLAPEKQMFDSFVRNYFNTHLLRRVQTIEPELNELVVRLWQEKVSERMALERELGGPYLLRTIVLFDGYVEHESNVSFEPTSRETLETGTVRNLFAENVLRCISLWRNQRVLDAFVEEWKTLRRRRAEELNDVYPILQRQPDVTIVVPAGTFTLLLNYGLNTQDQWTIPFQIKMIDGRTVLLLNCRNPPIRMSTHARKVKAYRLLVKSFMTFVAAGKQSEVSSGEKTAEPFRAQRFDEYMDQVERRKAQHTGKVETPKEARFYQTWKLQDKDEDHHFLVGYRQDCYESFRKMRLFMNISVKLEYQPEFGAEQMTAAELLQEWCRQLLRPNSKTMRLRINATTSTIISHHYLELRDIEEELYRLHGLKPRNLITNVWKMLKLIRNFPTGSYLLQRDGKSTQGPSVYERTIEKTGQTIAPGGGVTLNWADLLTRTEYDCPPLEQYDWIPIDKFVITQLHRVNTLFPCSFPHWTSVRRLNTRQRQMKVVAATKVKEKPAKKKGAKTKANKVLTTAQQQSKKRMQLRRQEARKQKLKAETIQQSLNQFAPYVGPNKAKPSEKVTGGSKETEGKETSGDQPSVSVTFDYSSFVKQAALEPDKSL
uniref:Little elongation complex subunit 2 C-terminal domain-containing protein n=1 Tax=Anopheles dirus TaxID=7168 RepID=A0A1Y9H2K1_9DIPT